jgi:hypothetical protein
MAKTSTPCGPISARLTPSKPAAKAPGAKPKISRELPGGRALIAQGGPKLEETKLLYNYTNIVTDRGKNPKQNWRGVEG